MLNLNPAQREAINTLSGPLLILAGAGAGKTKTIVERIVNLVRTGTDPKSILAITFTNKAANEMKERVALALKKDPTLNKPVSLENLPFVSTFHALGVYIIRENAKLLDLPRHFKIFDQGDSKQAIKEAIKAEGLDPKEFEPGRFLSIISREKGSAVSLREYESTVTDDFIGSTVAKIWSRYEKTLRDEKALDFDDLLFFAFKLLQREDVKSHYNSLWRYIHVDEYQDTNTVQYKIARALSEKEKNLCVVGDIDQNIYSWRGAKLKNILDFERDYPEAKVVVLEENYRSTQNILHAANEIIKKNEFRREKNLYTRNATGEAITLFEGYDETSEAEFVATKAGKLIEAGVAPEEIAVLYRANFQSRALEEAFLTYGLKYQILGTKFFERKEVKDILSYIRLALEPGSLSDLKRAINAPARGIGKVAFLKIIEGRTSDLPKAAGENYRKFQELMQKIREQIENKNPSNVVRFVIKESGLEESLSEKGSDEEERLLNIRELASIASRYDGKGGMLGIEEFLTNASLQSDQDELTGAPEGVKLMTVHAAKGLEFEYVFITGLEDGLFPHERILAGPKNEDDEEERRLFYVALTRAKKKLFLSYSQMRTLFGNKQVNVPSEFIYDIPESLMEKEEGAFGLLRKPLYKIDF